MNTQKAEIIIIIKYFKYNKCYLCTFIMECCGKKNLILVTFSLSKNYHIIEKDVF